MFSFLKKKPLARPYRRVIAFFSVCMMSYLLFSCSFMKKVQTKYYIACPTEWNTVDLFTQDKQVTGFLSDLMQDISLGEGIEIRLAFARESEAVALVNEGICDGYFSALPKSFSTEKKYDFSTPLFTSGYLIVVNKNSRFKTLEECANSNIGITRASLNRVLPLLNPSWRTYIYETNYEALNDIKSGRIDGALVDSLDMQLLMTGIYENTFRPLYPSLSPHEIRVVTLKTPKGAELVNYINKGRARLEEKGEISKHLQYWGITSLTDYSKE